MFRACGWPIGLLMSVAIWMGTLLCGAVAQDATPTENPFGGSQSSSREAAEPGDQDSSSATTSEKPAAENPFGAPAASQAKPVGKSEIRVTSEPEQGLWPPQSSIEVVDSKAQAARAEIEKTLRAKVSMEFVDVPLSDVMSFVQDRFPIPVVIDHRALRDTGISSAVPVTFHVQDVSLRSALQLMLQRQDLVYAIRNSVLSITTLEEIDDDLEVRLYAVADIMASDAEPSFIQYPQSSKLSPLVDAVETLIQPATWGSVGGPGVVTPLDEWGLLSIAQRGDVHEQVENLLGTIRQFSRSEDPMAAANDEMGFNGTSAIVLPPHERSAFGRIQKALDGVIELEFVDTPLQEVIKFFQHEGGFPILLDRQALDDVALSVDTPITLSLQGGSMRSALRIILREFELTYLFTQETLQITTAEEAENQRQCRVYPVADLKLPAEASSVRPFHRFHRFSSAAAVQAAGSPTSLDALVRVVTDCVEPASWDSVGGPGSIATLETRGIMMISHTQQVLRQVDHLIQAIRKSRQDKETGPPESLAAEDASETSVRLYPIRQQAAPDPSGQQPASMEEIVAAIKGMVAPSSWISAAEISPVGSTLVVRQTDEGHRQIEELLRALGVRGSAHSQVPGI